MWRLKYQAFIAHLCNSKFHKISLFEYLMRKYYKLSNEEGVSKNLTQSIYFGPLKLKWRFMSECFVPHVTVQTSGFNVLALFFLSMFFYEYSMTWAWKISKKFLYYSIYFPGIFEKQLKCPTCTVCFFEK